jgi:hypothetical protein
MTKPDTIKPMTINGIDTMLTGYDVIDGIWGLTDQDTEKLQLFEPFTSDIYPTHIVPGNGQQTYILPEFMTPTWPDTTNISFHTGTSTKSYSQSLSLSIDGSTYYDGFRGSVSTSLTSTTTQSSSYTMASLRQGKISVTLTVEPNHDLRPYLTKDARNAIDGTGEIVLTPNELIRAYGSHYLTGGVFGGVIETTAVGFTSNITDTEDIQASMKASYDILTHASVDASDKTASTAFNSSFTVNHAIHGGNNKFGVTALSTFAATDLAKWNGSVDANPTLIALNEPTPPSTGASVPAKMPPIPSPLAPIWDLCSDATRAAAIKAEFETMIASNPYSDGIEFVAVKQYGRSQAPSLIGTGYYQQLVQTVNPDFLASENPAGGWTSPTNDQFKSFYVATSAPVTSTPSADDVVPVYAYILNNPLDHRLPAGDTGLYFYSLDINALPQSLYPHATRVGTPIALPNAEPPTAAFFAFPKKVTGTVPVFQYVLDSGIVDQYGPAHVYRYSTETSLPGYTKSNHLISDPSNQAACIAYFAYPVIAS